MQKYLVLLVSIACLFPAVVSAQSSEHYSVVGANLNAGGTTMFTSSQYSASTTTGQGGVIGISNSPSYQALFGVQFIFLHTYSTSVCGGADEVLNYTIRAGETVNCPATNSLRLVPGFHAEEGSEFRGYIEQP